MANVDAWFGQVVAAVRQRSAAQLLARLSPEDSTARNCAHILSQDQARIIEAARKRFEGAGAKPADKWGTVSAEHLIAVNLIQQGKHVVRTTDEYLQFGC